MSSKESKLLELCEIVSSKRVFAASYQSEGIPFFRGKEVSQLARGENTTAELCISEDVYDDVVSRTGPINSGDILITAVGTLGNPYQVKETDLPFYFKDGNIVWLRKFSNNINSTYLLYWLNSDYGRRKVLDTAIGSTQAALTITGLGAISISCPSLAQQTGIVEILSAIDQKITANKALSKTLEDIAKTIFKSWFIDFDPVKAKMAGEKPKGMGAATAALFPDSIEESELGLIPKGWRVRSIGDSVIKQKVGKLFDSRTSFPYGTVPVLDQGKSGFVGYHDEEAGVFASPDMPLVVFANHTCLLRLISFPFSVIQNVFPLVGNKVDVIWLYFAVEGKQQFDSYKGHWPDFQLHKIIHPTEQATNAFRQTVEPLLKQKWLLEQQSKILASLRDSLLPRLISGELQIPEEMLAS